MITVNSNSRLFAFGCSVTHGCELVNSAQDSRNIPGSYPALLANQLGIEYINLAVCGASNEYIFHKIFENLESITSNDILLVCWTSYVRECWVNDNQHWFFIPSWGACLDKLEHNGVCVADCEGAKVVSDMEYMLNPVSDYYKLFMRYKTDIAQYKQKLNHYSQILNNLKIKTIELSCISTQVNQSVNIDFLSANLNQGLHPTSIEHQRIADFVIEKFFNA